jgi:predicted RNA binding protein YcfA (HicA-like mRNA interferase family)
MSYSRKKVLKALHDKGCRFLREGSRHTMLANVAGGHVEVPRHRDIKRGTARSIARQAGIEWHEF